MENLEEVQAYLASHQHDNLAEQMLDNTPDDDGGQEYTQELIYSVETKDKGWIDIKMGTLQIAFGDMEGEVEWEAELMTGGFWGGVLSDITGFKSLE